MLSTLTNAAENKEKLHEDLTFLKRDLCFNAEWHNLYFAILFRRRGDAKSIVIE